MLSSATTTALVPPPPPLGHCCHPCVPSLPPPPLLMCPCNPCCTCVPPLPRSCTALAAPVRHLWQACAPPLMHPCDVLSHPRAALLRPLIARLRMLAALPRPHAASAALAPCSDCLARCLWLRPCTLLLAMLVHPSASRVRVPCPWLRLRNLPLAASAHLQAMSLTAPTRLALDCACALPLATLCTRAPEHPFPDRACAVCPWLCPRRVPASSCALCSAALRLIAPPSPSACAQSPVLCRLLPNSSPEPAPLLPTVPAAYERPPSSRSIGLAPCRLGVHPLLFILKFF